jgi:DNA gyrase subunit B
LLDDVELGNSLLQSALNNARIYLNAEAPPLSAGALEDLAREFQIYRAIIGRLASRYDSLFLQELLSCPRLKEDVWEDAERLQSWIEQLKERLALVSGTAIDYQMSAVGESDRRASGLELIRLVHGIPETRVIPAEFFSSADYLRIAGLSEKLDGLVGSGARVERGEKVQEIESFVGAYDWLVGEAKRGYHIQRYKGLGEMNPGQLWETTMDPECRRLLKVTIEDAVAADQIFTTLMGDQVEPRREFIERNALEAGNIDI